MPSKLPCQLVLALCLPILVGIAFPSIGTAQEDAPPDAEASVPEQLQPTDLHLFLLAGQSNMAGRGKISDEDLQPHPRVLVLNKAGEWVPAVAPLHFDKPGIAGVGLGRTFAIDYAEQNPQITVGLIPCAVGGSSLDAWQPGGFHKSTQSHPYDDCMKRMRQALNAGELKGILWHQGESDSTPTKSKTYQSKLDELFERFRKEFDSPDVPIVIGQLGQFPEKPWDESRQLVDQAHQTLPERMTNTAFVHSDGLQHKGDQTHFSAEAYREFGRRYFRAHQQLTGASDE
ncbi:sialate O-acetylesterase [Rhodopirellula europaea]|uniref:Sialate O-acetylesterase domain-containing protein n=1 Tax=Rhodopirellula europaea 6C TaxID=1263867 RepID=M2AZ53_9BACT|nr:sialate O-acetylesterase [Rhodopirellula europaea]EMB17957.1 protein of unknown function acetylesterase [Rhodopirellula europaea 6C]